MPRRNIKITDDVFDRLNEDRQARDLSWSGYLATLHREATGEDVGTDVPTPDEFEDRVRSIVDDAVERTARRTADELESRLR